MHNHSVSPKSVEVNLNGSSIPLLDEDFDVFDVEDVDYDVAADLDTDYSQE